MLKNRYNRCMTTNLYEKAYALKEALEQHPDVLLLKTYEKVMENDAALCALAHEYHDLQAKLTLLLDHVDAEASEAKALRKALAQLKYQLDCHESVVAYQKQYKIVNNLYNKISQALFSNYCTMKEFAWE